MIKAVATGFAIYLVLMAALFLLQRRLIYLPDSLRPEPSAFGVPEMAPVALFTDDGLELLAWWRPPASADAPVMVYFHGNAGHIGYRGPKIRPYLDRGWGVLLTTWRGYSGNPGRPTESGLYADGRAALAFLKSSGVTPDRTILYGESLGSAVAAQLAADFPAAAVVLESPFTSIADIAARSFAIFPVRLLVRDKFDVLARIGRVRSPLLVVHGEGDAVVPLRHGRRLLEAANPPKAGHFVPGAGHNDLYSFGAAQAIIEFVDGHVGK
jgi:hypothetical protein